MDIHYAESLIFNDNKLQFTDVPSIQFQTLFQINGAPLYNEDLSVTNHIDMSYVFVYIDYVVTGIFPPGKVPGFAKYAVDANLFRLESSILTQAKRATSRNNVATEKREGGNFPRGEYT